MMHIRHFSLLAVALAASCAGGPAPKFDPDLEQQILQKRAQQEQLRERQEDFDKALIDIDKAIDSYASAKLHSEYQRSAQQADKIYTFLKSASTKHFNRLVRAADDASNNAYRAKAAGALGFSEKPEALDPLLNAINSDDATVATNAAFALGVLKDPRTPPAVLASTIENPELSPEERAGSANSMFQLQGALHDAAPAYAVWLRLLSEPPQELDPILAVIALRGLSRSRDAAHSEVATKFIAHPRPMVREMAAICLGYLGDRDTHEVLLTRLQPQETNPNVRLAARKALQALAGNIDRGYDVDQWRKVFQTRNG